MFIQNAIALNINFKSGRGFQDFQAFKFSKTSAMVFSLVKNIVSSDNPEKNIRLFCESFRV